MIRKTMLALLLTLSLVFTFSFGASAHSVQVSKVRPLTVDETVRCSGANNNNGATGNHAWAYVTYGDSNDGCNSKAYIAFTPTPAYVDYHMGTIASGDNRNFALTAYIPSGANAYMDYYIFQGSTQTATCSYNQYYSTGWTYICSFSVSHVGQSLTIRERTGQASPGLEFGSSAIQVG